MSSAGSPQSAHEEELGAARGRLKDTLARVNGLKKQLEAFLKTLKNWAHCTETASTCIAEAINPKHFAVGGEIERWASQQAALNERVGGSLAEAFDTAVMKPVLAWLESFKVVKDMLKEYTKAFSSRKHYEDKVAKLKQQVGLQTDSRTPDWR